MADLKDLSTAACLKALIDQGLTLEDIVALIKEGSREAVLEMGAEELKKQEEQR